MNDLELRALTLFVDVKNFFGNCWAENYNGLEEKLLKSLQDIDTTMTIKVNFFYMAI